MNISRPISSAVEAIDFSILSSHDICSLSVKQITNPQAIDPNLLLPNPSGLYDTALGAFLDQPCATCHLDTNACPGHPGHIDLPLNVFHCQFIDQVYKLLRAQCLFCRRLRFNRVDSTRLLYKLRLIRHGLLKQAEELEDIGARDLKTGEHSASEDGSGLDESEETGGGTIVAKRDNFTRREIGKALQNGQILHRMTESTAQARRAVVQEIFASMGKTRKCPFCQGYSPTYRKNRSISIFEKPLKPKEAARNAQNPQLKLNRLRDPLEQMKEARQKGSKKILEQAKHQEAQLRGLEVHSDEGVADLDSPSQDEDEVMVLDSPIEDDEDLGSSEDDEELEDVERNQTEDALSGNAMIESEPTMAKAKRRRKGTKQEQQRALSPDEVYARLTQLFDRDPEIFAEIYCPPAIGQKAQPPPVDMFFIKTIFVPPNRFRKESKTGPDEISEAADNAPYRHILLACEEIHHIRREMQAGSRQYADLQTAWIVLQGRVNALIDITKALGRPAPTDKGIKQKLEKKEGVMRMNVMGKRVNFAARSVISPDPNLEANEVGVPPVFAKKLTYPEPVTTHNFAELKQAVINGPNKWPGAVAIESETGQVMNLRRKNVVDRLAFANSLLAPTIASLSGARNKKVWRHLNNGDVVLMNRQPTLHKPSIMAHRAKVLPGEKTIRMHYANTNSYNADFDGDEMNMHFPQNEIARAEAMQVADTDHQYLSTTSGAPLRGLIQDHISMGVWLSCQDTMFTREEYHELLYCSLRPENNQTNSDRIKTVDPTVWKPAARWTGKDVITTVLTNVQPEGYAPLTMQAKCQIAADRWGSKSEEGMLRVDENLVLTGCLDKTQIGAKADGLVHAVYEAYGHVVAGKFVSILGRLLTRLLSLRAFSCGIEDLIVTDEGEETRHNAIRASENAGPPAAAQYVTLEEKRPMDDPELLERLEMVTREDEKLIGLDAVMRKTQNQFDESIVKATVPGGLCKSFPHNQMQTMTTSGAKGSHNNATRISAHLSQQNLEGRRVPIMISGKTLPSFRAFEPTLRAGGYITDRFLTGIRPQEYFFHSMSGREGLVDTAVKTSRSGYLQRCVIKGLESCKAGHDGSVHDVDGTLIQPLYGEDALEISQQAKITDFSFVASNFHSYLSKLGVMQDFKTLEQSDLNKREFNKKAEKRYRRTGDIAASDPALAVYPPTRFIGSSSEKYYCAARDYIENNPEGKVKDKKKGISGVVSKRALELIMDFNYLKAVVPMGDAVGVVAGQSIGEPSTQMTLNTFHMAGSAQNVTLGIPRLREILMAATKDIKTPAMTLHFIPEIPEEDRRKFANGISKRSLAEVVNSTEVSEQSGISEDFGEARIYNIALYLYPKDEYVSTYTITAGDIAWTLQSKFLPTLVHLIRKDRKRRGQAKSAARVSDSNPDIGKSSGRIQEQQGEGDADAEGGDSDAEDGGDDDATNAKRRQNADEGVTYDEPDESDEEIERAGEREASPGVPEDEGYGGSPAPGASRETSPAGTSQPTTPPKRRPAHANAEARAREEELKERHDNLTAFSFNDVDDGPADTCTLTLEFSADKPKLLLLPLIKQALRSSLVQEMEGISAATFVKPQKPGEPFFSEGSYVTTEGVNLKAFWGTDIQGIINPHRTYANSIHDMLELYGVECARDCIIQELHSVFSSHGISVDRRHLTLVADYMTRAGGYLPFNRIGMKDDASLFKKMSFETTVGFLRDTVLEGGKEELKGVSAALTVGKVADVGTGSFDVLMPMEVREEEQKKEVKEEEKSEGEDEL